MKPLKMKKKICKGCDTHFETIAPNALFHNRGCRGRYRRKQNKAMGFIEKKHLSCTTVIPGLYFLVDVSFNGVVHTGFQFEDFITDHK